MRRKRAFATTIACVLSACTAPVSPPPAAAPPAIPDAWIDARTQQSRARLAATPAGQLVDAAVEAHGGLHAWLAARAVRFEFDYRPVGDPKRRMHTESRVDIWNSVARQKELGEDADAELGWNGRAAWITPNRDAFPSTARFWATTPYYFFAMPFVAADPGVRYTQLEDAPLAGVTHHLVKLTYAEGTGDSPGDYYVLYLHPETHRLSALRYVVAYPGFFPQGGHTPEKLMVFHDQRAVQGLLVAHRYEVFAWDEAKGPGDKVTDVEVPRVVFGEHYDAALFDPPTGADVSTEIEVKPR